MASLLKMRVPLAWLLLVMIGSAAAGIIWKVAVIDAPPHNAVLISDSSDAPGVAVAPTTTRQALAPPSPTRPAATSTPDTIAVYVSGAVAKPGVVSLPAGARAGDAVQVAGGLLPEADAEQVNLSARLTDEQHIYIPRKGEAAPSVPPTPNQATPTDATAQPPSQPAEPAQTQAPANLTPTTAPPPSEPPAKAPPAGTGDKININTASQAELESLPGIGPTLAGRIIAYRQQNGPFQTLDELEDVKGIGPATMAKLRDLITVGP